MTQALRPPARQRLLATAVGLAMIAAATAFLGRGHGLGALTLSLALLVHGADVLAAGLTGQAPWCAAQRRENRT